MLPVMGVMSLMVAVTANAKETADDKEIWYDATGKVVKVTRAGKTKSAYIPDWKKRELERLARMETQRRERPQVQRTRSGYWSPYQSYYPSYGYPYSHGWSCRPAYYGRGHGHYSGRSSFRFQGSYQRNGWSVRVNF